MARKKPQFVMIKNRSRLTIAGIRFDFYPGDKWQVTTHYPGKPDNKEVGAALLPDLKEKMII